jgi:hypothetical protein
MQQNITDKAYLLSRNGYFFNVNHYINTAWTKVKPHWLILSSFTAVYVGVIALLLRMPEIGQIVQMIVSGPISAGYYLSIHRIFNNQPISFESFLEGFKIFLPTMIVSMLVGLLITVGFVLLVIPGFFFMLIYLFAMPLVVFDRIDFWPAMESSRVIIMKRFKEALILGIAIIGINILGAMALGIGIFFTIPLSYAIIYTAYHDIYGMEEEETENENKFNYFR